MTTVDPRRSWTARQDLAAAFRLAVRFGMHEGICNHFSLMVPHAEDLFVINPQGLHWSEITAGNLVVADVSGRIVAGEGEIEPTAFHIHTCIHRQVAGARCVLHTHMPYATSLTTLDGGRLLPISQTACMFYQRIAYEDEYAGLAVDDAEGDRIAAALKEKDLLFLASHGIIVTGRDVAHAFNDLYYLERACQLQVLARSTGDQLRILPHDTALKTALQFQAEGEQQIPLHFAALKRILDREEPDYAS